MGFRELRIKAGYADREEFCKFAGISPRSLTAYDSGAEEPPRHLTMLLQLLADGCRYCRRLKETCLCQLIQ